MIVLVILPFSPSPIFLSEALQHDFSRCHSFSPGKTEGGFRTSDHCDTRSAPEIQAAARVARNAGGNRGMSMDEADFAAAMAAGLAAVP